MSSAPPRPPHLGPGERFVAWVLTGPVGRVAAFVGDLGAYWLGWARRRFERR